MRNIEYYKEKLFKRTLYSLNNLILKGKIKTT